MAAHGHPRATGDLDIWIRASVENAKRVYQGLAAFGVPLHDLTVEDLATAGVVFQIGVEPCRIDILNSISGVDFEHAWARRQSIELDGVHVAVISRADLITNKRAAGRAKDLADVETLERDSE